MKAIFKREVKSYFTGMIGWVVAAVSLFFLGLYYTNRNLLYASSDFASVLYTMTMILLFLLPAKQTPQGEKLVEYMLYMLWDLGL